MSSDAFDEFSFLPEQAADLRLTGELPAVRRLSLPLADGRTLSALRFGDAPAEVAFLHGAGLNAHTWDTTVLSLGVPALAIDLPGHGDSSWREDADYSPRGLAVDVVAGLEAWTGAPIPIVGHSLGGLTAAAVAAGGAHLVTRLAIIDITPGVDPDAGPTQIRDFFAGPTDWASRDELVERALAFGLGGTRRAAERGVYLNSRVRADGRVEWKHHFARLASAPAPASSERDAVDRLLAEAGWADLDAVAVPVTLIRGERGYVTPADAAEFSRHLPQAEVVNVATGHNVHEQDPTALAGIIRRIVSV